MPGTLYLVATPIGNLHDVTTRAVETLESVDLIACEDTRHTRKLLNHLGVKTRLVSYHEHNEAERADEIARLLDEGQSVAIVSDAGTPGISDPSFRAVQKAIEIGADVVPIPGAVAFVNAVVASGLPTDSIFFGGFLPSRKTERRRRLRDVSAIPATLVFYESPRRIAGAVSDCLEIMGDRDAAVARELTKLHETFHRGKLSALVRELTDATFKGEFVLLIDRDRNEKPGRDKTSSLAERFAELEREGLDHKWALKRVAKEFGISRSEAYREIQSSR